MYVVWLHLSNPTTDQRVIIHRLFANRAVCSTGYRMAATMSGADGFEGPRRKVLVTGAAGRTGSLVFKKLQAKPGACVCVRVVLVGLGMGRRQQPQAPTCF